MWESAVTPSKYSVKEISALIGISTTTLRNWEEFFSVPVNRNGLGYREYTENSIKIFKKINSWVKEGLQLKEIKPLLNDELEAMATLNPKIQIIQSEPEEKQKDFELILKPYQERIKKLEEKEEKFFKESLVLIKENATLTERLKGKDELFSLQKKDWENKIQELQQQKQELEARLNRKWWQFGF